MLVEISARVHRHLAYTELNHVPLADLVPSTFEPPDRQCVKPRKDGNHSRKVVETSTVLGK